LFGLVITTRVTRFWVRSNGTELGGNIVFYHTKTRFLTKGVCKILMILSLLLWTIGKKMSDKITKELFKKMLDKTDDDFIEGFLYKMFVSENVFKKIKHTLEERDGKYYQGGTEIIVTKAKPGSKRALLVDPGGFKTGGRNAKQ